ncbi:probable GPI-anchored adhesin-like protein PGA55 [Pyrus communis]|uniref:probable GPI-anchored adhesin-like protein PGA55 n=1 Tax=Pyrus communis TaxID=23211 RepID=UPI0035BEC26E
MASRACGLIRLALHFSGIQQHHLTICLLLRIHHQKGQAAKRALCIELGINNGRTPLPKFSDIRTASQYPNHEKPKSSHPTCSNNVINRPEGNRTAIGASAKSFTDAVLALPAFVTVGNEAGHSRIHKLHFQKNGDSLWADVSQSSQVSSLENQVNDPGFDVSLTGQVKSMESQVKDPGDKVLSSQVESLQSLVKYPEADVSLSSQNESLHSQVKDLEADVSPSSQVKSSENQVNDPGG